MNDKQTRHSHVRLIEDHDARKVVHWRYAPIDVRYQHPMTDLDTGWSDWVDEYYTIYPNAIGVRKITLQEVANFAKSRNVCDEVLRMISNCSRTRRASPPDIARLNA